MFVWILDQHQTGVVLMRVKNAVILKIERFEMDKSADEWKSENFIRPAAKMIERQTPILCLW